MSLDNLNEYRVHHDKFDSLYTFVVHDTFGQELADYVHKMLDRIKAIRDTTRRKYLNDRIFALSTYILNKKSDTKINSVILVGSDIHEIPLNSKHKGTLSEYNIYKILYKNKSKFDIDFLTNLFFDFSFRDILKLKNVDIEHTRLNSTKKKIVMVDKTTKIDIDEYIRKNVSGKCVIHGISGAIKSIKSTSCHIFSKFMTDEEIFEVFDRDETLIIHKSLEEVLGYIQNEKKSHLVKFGKEIIENAYNVKTLYCSLEKVNKVKAFFAKKSLTPEVLTVNSLEKGDMGCQLQEYYGGTIAVMYY